MKKLLSLLLMIIVAGTTLGQQPTGPSYQDQYVQLYKEFMKDPQNIVNLIDMAVFFSDAENPQCNLALAAGYIKDAETLFTAWVKDPAHSKDMRKLIRKGVSINVIRQHRKDVEAKAVTYVKSHLNEIRVIEAQHLEEAFSKNAEIVKLLHNKTLTDRYKQACAENTIDGYYAFIKSYPSSHHIDSAENALSQLAPRFFSAFTTEEAIDSVAALYPVSNALQQAAMKQKSRMAFADACRVNTIESYSSYLERYPRGVDYVEALSKLQRLRDVDFNTLTKAEELADFAENHAADPLADSALAKLRGLIFCHHDQTAVQLYLSRFPLDENYSNIYKEYYTWFSAEGNRQPIEAFAAANPEYPYQLSVESDLALGSKIDAFDLTKTFSESEVDTMSTIIKLLTGRKVSFVALQRILQQQIARQDWNAAKARLQKFELCFEDVCNEEYQELAAVLSENTPAKLSYQLSADSIAHVIPHPSGLLYFTRRHQGHNSVFFAKKTAGKTASWKLAGKVNIDGANVDVVAYNFFDEGKRVLLGMGGDIWTAEVQGDSVWTLEHHLPNPVNTPYVERDAFMLADGTGMLLASDRPGGQNVQKSYSYYHGDHKPATDIYFIPYQKGRWGDAVNLGVDINSAYCELSPILSKNMRTLYFVTDARGMGYGDVYRATRTDIDDWTHWSKPKNMGRGVNGAFNESSVAFTPSERHIMLTTNSPKGGKYASYSFATQHDTTSAYRNVEVDLTQVLDVLRSIDVAPVWRQQVTEHLTDREVDSVLSYNLYKDKDYAIIAETDWFYVPTIYINGGDYGRLEVRKYGVDELRSMKDPMPLRLVKFHDGATKLLPLAEAELRHLGRFMQQRTVTKAEITVHVNGADDKKCYELSLERAKAIRAFLADYGVAPTRIRIAGYGNVMYKKGDKPEEVGIKFF